MAVYALGDEVPTLHPDAFVHPEATVIGRVRIGAGSTVWPSAVLRGDYGRIEIGERTSIQDGTVVHATAEHPTVVGDGCVIGHLVHLEGCAIADGALVGSGSIVLHRATVGAGAVVGAAALVGNDMEVPAGMRAYGVPAKLREGAPMTDFIAASADRYVEMGQLHAAGLRRID
ncbi:MAG: gamma carbonic anhydrase family protein [Solirubrobacterales bacterium]|nr:gamma carbonic anhydrase family protein [Solirubrobacterales bacterium]